MQLFARRFFFNAAWHTEKSQPLFAYVEIHFHFRNLCFSVQVNNKGFCNRNIFIALIDALESETVGMQKYSALKDRVRTIGAWQKL
jgi:hypothetical protein